jgi:hypothetical protein
MGDLTHKDIETFRKEAEECLSQAANAATLFDRKFWGRLAEEWTKLADEVEARGSGRRA